jgi:hypothetical protein
MPISSNVLKFRPRTELRDLCAPDREADEKLLRVIQGFEDRGVTVAFEGEAATREGAERDAIPGAGSGVADRTTSPNNFVSQYLTRPLRSEAEVRALRNQPRVPKALGLIDPLFAAILAPFRPVS